MEVCAGGATSITAHNVHTREKTENYSDALLIRQAYLWYKVLMATQGGSKEDREDKERSKDGVEWRKEWKIFIAAKSSTILAVPCMKVVNHGDFTSPNIECTISKQAIV